MDAAAQRKALLARARELGLETPLLEELTLDSLTSLLLASEPEGADGGPSLKDLERQARGRDAIAPYLAAVSQFEASKALRIAREVASGSNLRDLVFGFVLPIVREVGKRWSHAELGVGHEHLVTSQLRATLLARHAELEPAWSAPRLVAATPAGHRHEFGVLVGAMLALAHGFEVIYLGVDLPDDDILWCAHKSSPQILLLALSMGAEQHQRTRLVTMLTRLSPRTRLWVGGPDLDKLSDLGITPFGDFDVLDRALGAHMKLHYG